MKRTVKEVAERAGVSVRTLHYYDEIGLLRPSETTLAGYRLYDDAAFERLLQILFFREMDFPLREIRDILDDPTFDRCRALERHRQLLCLKKERLERLIRLVDSELKGEKTMGLQAFDSSEIERAQREFAEEAREKWGKTGAYVEQQKKTKGYQKDDWEQIQQEMDGIFSRLARLRDPASPEAQQLAAEWQQHITAHYYACTLEILAGLGEMYRQDARFIQWIDGRYGEGTAQKMHNAIRLYCQK